MKKRMKAVVIFKQRNILKQTQKQLFLFIFTVVYFGVWLVVMVRKKKSKSYCKLCNKQTVRTGYKYCSNVCQQEYQYCQFIEKWKQGKENGLRNIGVVSRYVKKYLRRKYYNKCCLCGWSKVNPKSGLVPLVADHIDGD